MTETVQISQHWRLVQFDQYQSQDHSWTWNVDTVRLKYQLDHKQESYQWTSNLPTKKSYSLFMFFQRFTDTQSFQFQTK